MLYAHLSIARMLYAHMLSCSDAKLPDLALIRLLYMLYLALLSITSDAMLADMLAHSVSDQRSAGC